MQNAAIPVGTAKAKMLVMMIAMAVNTSMMVGSSNTKAAMPKMIASNNVKNPVMYLIICCV